MRIGIISDVHSNLQALEEVMKKLKKEKPDKVFFLGDVVGYGANPNECCEILREIADVCLLGNHDAGMIDKIDLSWFNPDAKTAILWTKEVLNDENIQFIKTFQYTFEKEELLFSHGSPVEPQEFIYVFSKDEAENIFKWNSGRYRVIFVAHSHITLSFIYTNEGRVSTFIEDEIHFEKDAFYVINVGSVGQPRDGDPRAFFAILDVEKKFYKTFRVEYDYREAAERILKSGLPPFLAFRLAMGE